MHTLKLQHEKALVPDEVIQKTAASLKGYIDQLEAIASEGGYEADEASFNLPFDAELR
jgi:hypothetical protein